MFLDNRTILAGTNEGLLKILKLDTDSNDDDDIEVALFRYRILLSPASSSPPPSLCHVLSFLVFFFYFPFET